MEVKGREAEGWTGEVLEVREVAIKRHFQLCLDEVQLLTDQGSGIKGVGFFFPGEGEGVKTVQDCIDDMKLGLSPGEADAGPFFGPPGPRASLPGSAPAGARAELPGARLELQAPAGRAGRARVWGHGTRGKVDGFRGGTGRPGLEIL